MRAVIGTCLLGLIVTCPASAQFPFGPRPFGYAPCDIGYPRGFRGIVPIFGYGWSQPTIVIVQPVVIVPALPLVELDQTRALANFLNRLPQAPPREELALLRQPKAPKVARVPKLAPEPAPKAPLLAPPAAADKNVEANRQLNLGREAFAAGAPGRALERFERAAKLVPDNAESQFLIAQAQLALGRYREAAAAVLAGLKLKPDGPGAAFNPRELYGRDAAAHTLDLDQLRQASARHPDEPALSFFYGYQLWLNGRKEEARPYLERAAAQATDPAPIQRLLDARDVMARQQ